MRILVIDVGGSHVKLGDSESGQMRQFDTPEPMSPGELVECVRSVAGDWAFDVISLGLPAAVGPQGPVGEPWNVGRGWVGFDFERAFGKPVRIINDATMQALGAYDGGRMLFLGMGTGVGSAYVAQRIVVPMELGELPWEGGRLMETIGRKGFERLGEAKWREAVIDAATQLKKAFAVDYVMLGGGKAGEGLLDPLPEGLRRGGNQDAFAGGVRLWQQPTEPHQPTPGVEWRVIV